MYRTGEETVKTDLSLACFFIFQVNFIKIKANKTETKWLDYNMIT